MLAADPSGDGKGEKAFEKVLDVWRRHEVFPLEDIAAVMMAAASTPRPPPTAGHAAAAPLLAPGAYQAVPVYEYFLLLLNSIISFCTVYSMFWKVGCAVPYRVWPVRPLF